MKKYFIVVFVFLFLLFTNIYAQNFAKSHIPANHVCDGSVLNNCFGYAQARAMGKTVGDAVCDPQTSYADGIDLTKFSFTDDPNLVGIQIGDIVILNANNEAEGHAAVVSFVPSPFNINNILVDQVSNSGGAESLDVNLGSQIAIYGDPIGFCPTEYWKRVSVVLLNDFDSGTLEVDKTTIRTYPYGGQPLPKPTAPPDPNPFITAGNGCWALFYPTSGTNINTLFRAIDNQTYGSYDRKFARWEKDYGIVQGTDITLQKPESGSCTYTAVFSRVFNITCQNNFSGSGGGIINVEGTNHNSGWVEPITEDIDSQQGQITLQAINNQVISGIEYIFDHWSTGSTSNPSTFTVTNHQIISAVFKARLSVNLNGPDFLGSMVQGTFTANPSGGSSTYTNYRWWERKDEGCGGIDPRPIPNSGGGVIDAPPQGEWIYQSSWEGQQTVQVARSYNFSLKCEVTDSDNNTATDIHSVVVGGGLAKSQSVNNDEISTIAVPNNVELSGNYPNPFNPSTTIRFGLPEDGNVKITIYSINGQEVTTLANRYFSKGYHEIKWDGKNPSGRLVANGLYITELKTGNQRLIKKMIFAK